MITELTKKEKSLLWVSRIFGALLSAALVCFIVLFYLNFVNDTIFVLASLGLGCIIMALAAINLNIKSTKFFTFFTFACACIFAVAFAVVLAVYIESGVIVFSK